MARHPDGTHLAIGMPVLHTPTGRSGRIVVVHDGRVVLRDPSGVQFEVPFDEIDAFGELLSPQEIGAPDPGSRQGGYGGAPASHSKAVEFSTPEGMLKLARSTIQRGSPFARTASTGALRKGGSQARVRGERVRNRRGQVGTVLGSGTLTCSVEYVNGPRIAVVLEKLRDLESA